nr:unnamed protein product [Callosobruchus analis]CAI5830056.1 unnamed protein product [Callosobruchus analis]CAI5862000.1 unnamed protein product [Callosobruchus analis]
MKRTTRPCNGSW